jgi:hypothetical protein
MSNQIMQIVALLEISISSAVILLWIGQKLLGIQVPFAIRILLLLALVNILFWPLGMGMELPLSAYVRGVTGDLSIMTLLLLWTSILPNAKRVPLPFIVGLVLVAIPFYPMALGLGMIDPYAWGYGSIALVGVVIAVAFICGLVNWIKGVWILSFALVAWSLHWHESSNLWDYVLDPLLVIWAVCAIVYRLQQRRRQKQQSGYLFRAG